MTPGIAERTLNAASTGRRLGGLSRFGGPARRVVLSADGEAINGEEESRNSPVLIGESRDVTGARLVLNPASPHLRSTSLTSTPKDADQSPPLIEPRRYSRQSPDLASRAFAAIQEEPQTAPGPSRPALPLENHRTTSNRPFETKEVPQRQYRSNADLLRHSSLERTARPHEREPLPPFLASDSKSERRGTPNEAQHGTHRVAPMPPAPTSFHDLTGMVPISYQNAQYAEPDASLHAATQPVNSTTTTKRYFLVSQILYMAAETCH